MEKSFLLRSILAYTLILFFIFPLLYLLAFVPMHLVSWDPFIVDVAWGATYQAILSTSLTIVLAFLGALGYFATINRVSKTQAFILNCLLIMPSFLPPIIVVICGAKAIGSYVTGLEAIVFYHLLMNVGIVGYLMAIVLQKKAADWARLCSVEGVGAMKFLFYGLIPGIKNEISSMSIFLFILYFLSFSIPLLVGSVGYSGLEVFIYEKIFFFGQWHEAIQYSFAFMILLFIVSQLFEKKETTTTVEKNEDSGLKYYSYTLFIFILCLPAIILMMGLLRAIPWQEEVIFGFLKPQARGTLTIGLLTGCLSFVVMSVIGYSFKINTLSRWILALISPSWAVIGFSFFLLGSNTLVWSIVKACIALTVLYVPYLFRLAYFHRLNDLKSQVDVATICGASWSRIYFRIIWPQVLPTICFLSGIASLWACGDFAMTGMLLGDSVSLSLQMKSYMMNYRLDEALVILAPLIIISLFVFLIFQGFGYVCRRSLLS